MTIRHVAMTIIITLSALCSAAHAADIQLPLTDDAWINGNAPNTSFGTATTLTIHNYGPKQALARFDASTIAGKTVTQATLKVFLRTIDAAGQLTVYPIVSSWKEGTVTWALQPPTEATAAASLALTTGMKGSVISIDVTSVVQRWADGTLADAGFLLTTVNPIKASIDSKEYVSGDPATLAVSTSSAPFEPSRAIVLDLSNAENCAIDAPGYYMLDRTWRLSPSGGVEPNAACGTAIQITSGGVTLDLRGFAIEGGSAWGNYNPVLSIDTSSAVTLKDGTLRGVFVAIGTTVGGSTVTLENIRTGGGVLLGSRSVTAIGGSYSASFEPALQAGAGSNVARAAFDCTDTHCLGLKGLSRISDCAFNVSSVGPPAISLIGNESIVEGNIFGEIAIEGNGNIVAGNFAKAGAGLIAVNGAYNIIERNIGLSIAFATPGNFYGNNRTGGNFTGTDGNVDWGGNIIY